MYVWAFERVFGVCGTSGICVRSFGIGKFGIGVAIVVEKTIGRARVRVRVRSWPTSVVDYYSFVTDFYNLHIPVRE